MHKQLCRCDSTKRCLDATTNGVCCDRNSCGLPSLWCCLWPSRKITQMSSYNMTIGRRKSTSMWILSKRVSVVAGVTTDHGRQCESHTWKAFIELLVRKVIRTYIPLLTALAPMVYWNNSFISSSSLLLEKLDYWPLSWRFLATLLQNWFMAPGFKPTRWITGMHRPSYLCIYFKGLCRRYMPHPNAKQTLISSQPPHISSSGTTQHTNCFT